MNDTITRICAHKTNRHLKNQALEPAIIDTLIRCAQASASSQFIQAYSIIHITDNAIKRTLAERTGHPQTAKNGALFIMIADLHRHAQLLDNHEELQTTETLLTTVIDTALASQNLVLAAESLGLGTCYLSSIREHDQLIIDLLQLPEYTYPLFGIAVGYPETDDHSPSKPRLPSEHIYMENRYQSIAPEQYHHYNQTLRDYYQARQIDGIAWTDKIRALFSKPTRHHVSDTLHRQHLNQR